MSDDEAGNKTPSIWLAMNQSASTRGPRQPATLEKRGVGLAGFGARGERAAADLQRDGLDDGEYCAWE